MGYLVAIGDWKIRFTLRGHQAPNRGASSQRGRGRPAAYDKREIAEAFESRMAEVGRIKAAILDVQAQFGVSRSTVNRARKLASAGLNLASLVLSPHQVIHQAIWLIHRPHPKRLAGRTSINGIELGFVLTAAGEFVDEHDLARSKTTPRGA